jgi:hypothetical protein
MPVDESAGFALNHSCAWERQTEHGSSFCKAWNKEAHSPDTSTPESDVAKAKMCIIFHKGGPHRDTSVAGTGPGTGTGTGFLPFDT